MAPKLGTAEFSFGALSDVRTNMNAAAALRTRAAIIPAANRVPLVGTDSEASLKIRLDGLRPLAPTSHSKIGFLRDWDRPDMLMEVVSVVFGAYDFDHGALVHAAVALDRVPGRGEGARILNMDVHLERLSLVDHVETFNHMQLLGVRCEVIVDEGLGREPDRIDDKRIAFVTPDRLAEPGRRGLRRMR